MTFGTTGCVAEITADSASVFGSKCSQQAQGSVPIAACCEGNGTAPGQMTSATTFYPGAMCTFDVSGEQKPGLPLPAVACKSA